MRLLPRAAKDEAEEEGTEKRQRNLRDLFGAAQFVFTFYA